MRLRSLLFVPGDSERKFAKARDIGADVLILDLEDSVAPTKKQDARKIVSAVLETKTVGDSAFFVRINPFESGMTVADLIAVVKPGLDGILLPKADGAQDVARISEELEKLEAAAGMTIGTVKIAVVSTETPKAMFSLGSYTPRHPRLIALTWGAEDLSAAVGATANKETSGEWTSPYQLARSLCLFAAASAEVAPLETLYADFRDSEGLERDCRRARRDGFTGRIAIHPDQVAIINSCFSPSAQQIAEAQMIVDAFAAQPDAGTHGLNGKMYDIPHLKAALKTLASAS
jgi:citrate lyase subunit beta / citryl-CoA lyase